MSCAKDALLASVRPATTARIVAKATAAMTARTMVPPTEPKKSSPIVCASCRAAVLPLALSFLIAAGPTSAAAPKPSAMVMR